MTYNLNSEEVLFIQLCCWNEVEQLHKFLKTNESINLVCKNGRAFCIAICNEYIGILVLLLQHYHRQKLEGNPLSEEYKTAKQKLNEIIQDGVESSNISEEMREIVKPYIVEEDDPNDYILNFYKDEEKYSNDIEIKNILQLVN